MVSAMDTATPTPAQSIDDVATLRAGYGAPSERAVKKLLPALDHHMREFIALSPLLVLGTSSEAGADVSPRGDRPGFVHVLDDRTLLVPDWPGNNRLDSLANVVANPQVALLLFVPGVDETLRVNGIAEVTTEPALVARWDVNGRQPKSVLRVHVREAFLHCGKALIRSKFWKDDFKVSRDRLAPYGQMLKDQAKVAQTAEEIQAMVEDGYANKLY
jgi:PPOX class probable FMN-dependent enzyme